MNSDTATRARIGPGGRVICHRMFHTLMKLGLVKSRWLRAMDLETFCLTYTVCNRPDNNTTGECT